MSNVWDRAQLEARGRNHHCPRLFFVRQRQKKYISEIRPELWAVFRRCRHGDAMLWRGTKEECEAKCEEYELLAALHAMTEGTPAEGEKLCQ